MNDPFCSERRSDAAATAAAMIANVFEWPGQPPKIAHSIGDLHPSNMVPWAHRVFFENGISIGTAVSAQLAVEYPITLQWAATFSPQIVLFPWKIGSPI